jgi:hypothetical protein
MVHKLSRGHDVRDPLRIMNIGSVAEQQFSCVPVPVNDGLVERGEVLVVQAVDVRSSIQEHHHDL